MRLKYYKTNWLRIALCLLTILIISFSYIFIEDQVIKSKTTKLISSARQVSFWINDFTDSKMRRPKDLDEVFEFSSSVYGVDADKVISDFKAGKVLYNRDANPGDVMIRWEVNKSLIIVVTPEGRVILSPDGVRK